LKAIDEIRQLNKKKTDGEQKKEEEEAKHQKDEEEARKKTEKDLAREKEEEIVTKYLHNIMSGINGVEDIMEIDGMENNDEDNCSPLKKRGGSSKTYYKTYIRQNTQDCFPSGSTPSRKSTINPKSNAVYGHLHSPPQEDCARISHCSNEGRHLRRVRKGTSISA
jgi:hypothetical protein